ncbi:MAG: WYL domain-containing protein [Gemmatimonadetes bacterium]|nr:WYL domain-containing protein [Gemmatimonadota bacterium]
MATRDLTTARARLERLLYILPAAARAADGISIAELASALGVGPGLVLEDLQEATARSYYQPGGSSEDFSIFVEGDRVTVFAVAEFQRPVRLNLRESLALELGLRALAADGTGERRAQVLALAARLGRALSAPLTTTVQDQRAGAPPEPELEAADTVELSLGDDGFRGVVNDALAAGRACTLVYLKAGAAAPESRRVVPRSLVFAAGRWYLVAYDLERAEARIFRLDRTLDVQLATEPPPDVPPIDVAALLQHGMPYYAQDEIEVVVRYSPRIAPWVSEQVPAEIGADGSARVCHRVADPRWRVRHVFQYGGEAVVESPPAARGWVARAVAAQAH